MRKIHGEIEATVRPAYCVIPNVTPRRRDQTLVIACAGQANAIAQMQPDVVEHGFGHIENQAATTCCDVDAIILVGHCRGASDRIDCSVIKGA